MFSTVHRSFELLSRRQKAAYIVIIFSGAVISSLDAIGIGMVAILANRFSAGDSERWALPGLVVAFAEMPIWLAVCIITLLFGIKSVFSILYVRQLSLLLARAEGDVSERIARSAFSGGLAEFKSASRSEIEWAIVRSTTVAIQGVLGQIGIIAISFFSALFVVAVMLAANPTLTLTLLISISGVLVATHFYYRQKVAELGKTISHQTVSLGNLISSVVSTYKELTVYGRVDTFLQKISERRRSLASATARMSFLAQLPRAILEFSLILAISGYAFLFLQSPDLSQALASFPLIVIGGFRILGALLPLQRALTALVFDAPQARKSQDFVVERVGRKYPLVTGERNQNSTSSRWEGASNSTGVAIALEGVSYSYQSKKGPVRALTDVSMEILPGEIVAIIGKSGAGKTTLADLVLGLEVPTKGSIKLDQISPQRYLKEHPGKVAFVPRSPGTISGSLMDNITFEIDGGSFDPARVHNVVSLSGLARLVNASAEGLGADMGKFADGLSSGQMQMLGLARALYRDPRLLILDEGTNSLDVDHQASVIEIVRGMRGKVTVVVIAHSPEVVQVADKVIFLEDGVVRASGKIEDVKKTSEKAARLLFPTNKQL